MGLAIADSGGSAMNKTSSTAYLRHWWEATGAHLFRASGGSINISSDFPSWNNEGAYRKIISLSKNNQIMQQMLADMTLSIRLLTTINQYHVRFEAYMTFNGVSRDDDQPLWSTINARVRLLYSMPRELRRWPSSHTKILGEAAAIIDVQCFAALFIALKPAPRWGNAHMSATWMSMHL